MSICRMFGRKLEDVSIRYDGVILLLLPMLVIKFYFGATVDDNADCGLGDGKYTQNIFKLFYEIQKKVVGTLLILFTIE